MNELDRIAEEMREAREYAELDRPASETNARTNGALALRKLLTYLTKDIPESDRNKVIEILADYEAIEG